MKAATFSVDAYTFQYKFRPHLFDDVIQKSATGFVLARIVVPTDK